MKFIIFTVLFAGACVAFPQDANPIGSVVSGLTGDSSGGAGLLALLGDDPDLIQQLVGESGSVDSLTAELNDVADELTGTVGATVTDLEDNIENIVGELPSLSGDSSDDPSDLLDGLLDGGLLN